MTKKIRLGTLLLAAVVCLLPPVAVLAQNWLNPNPPKVQPHLVVTSLRIQWDKGPHPKKATVTTTFKNAGHTVVTFHPESPLSLIFTAAWAPPEDLFMPTFEIYHISDLTKRMNRILPGQILTDRWEWTTKNLGRDSNWRYNWRYDLCVRLQLGYGRFADLGGKCTGAIFSAGTVKSHAVSSSSLSPSSKRRLRLLSEQLQRVRSEQARTTGRPVLGAGGNMEMGVDRPGDDYWSVPLAKPRPALCRGFCAGDTRCRSWTYVKPGIKAPQAVCYLKKTVPPPRHNTCCVSGVK